MSFLLEILNAIRSIKSVIIHQWMRSFHRTAMVSMISYRVAGHKQRKELLLYMVSYNYQDPQF